jgi:hypothetical protein
MQELGKYIMREQVNPSELAELSNKELNPLLLAGKEFLLVWSFKLKLAYLKIKFSIIWRQ